MATPPPAVPISRAVRLCDHRARAGQDVPGRPAAAKAATGEVATDEELGGAEMHATVAGTAEYLAEDDADGIRQAREILGALPWNENLPLRQEPQMG